MTRRMLRMVLMLTAVLGTEVISTTIPAAAATAVVALRYQLHVEFKTVTCPSLGYSLQVPSRWRVVLPCTGPALLLVARDKSVGMAVRVTSQSGGNDATARAAIRQWETDGISARMGQVVLKGPSFHTFVANHRHFVEGDASVIGLDGTVDVLSDAMAYAHGQAFSFQVVITIGDDSSANRHNIALVNQIWSTIRIP